MSIDENILWTKISNFQLDHEESSFTFSDRVARENGWTKSYTLRVIEEYKKFIYLCCVSEEGVTPSDPVDQVWHLHLTYTKSYWIDFCQDTIGKPIHHNPTKGGAKEAKKFNDYYSRLKDIYWYHFDKVPPTDIWHSNEDRFSDINFQRVNLKRYWLIKKPSRFILSIFTLGIIGVIAIASIQAEGYPVLLFLGILVVVGTIHFVSDYRKRNNKKDNKKDGGCSGDGLNSCSGSTGHYYADSGHPGDHGHHSGDSGHDSGHSGCSSGCSGCSGSGCSGCGGGGD